MALSTKYFILIQNPNFTICAQGHTENPEFAPLLCCTETAFCLKAETTACRLCQGPVESLTNVITQCRSTSEPRVRIFSELGNLIEETDIDNFSSKLIHNENFANLLSTPRTLTQFILDCTSFNLPDEYRYNINDVKVNKIFKLTRDLCFSIHTLRIKSLNANKWKVT